MYRPTRGGVFRLVVEEVVPEVVVVEVVVVLVAGLLPGPCGQWWVGDHLSTSGWVGEPLQCQGGARGVPGDSEARAALHHPCVLI